MDENASRAVFIGVSVFVAIITISLILVFYNNAKEAASVANRYDITVTEDAQVNKILNKRIITGLELRYLMNYYADNQEVSIHIYFPGENVHDITTIPGLDEADDSAYWSQEYQIKLDNIIRPNYNFGIAVDNSKGIEIIATFEN